MNPPRILIAGIGNIFLGDDAFGVEVARELSRRTLPAAVRVADFGTRGYDLAFALTEGCETVILVDAAPRGQPPGTVCLIEPDLEQIAQLERSAPDGHNLDPVHVLQLAEMLGGGRPERLYVVGCEPAEIDLESGGIGLSDPVRGAVPEAIALIESLLSELLQPHPETTIAGAAPGAISPP